MNKIIIPSLLALALLTSCLVVPEGRHHNRDGVILVPVLPTVVVLDPEPYYFYNGYHYHYQSSRWYYSRSRSGPWTDLPRDHYPKEVRFKGRGHNQHDDERHRH
ncbi:MAG: hypothetical protein PHI06_02620 [Desulfobulbaceae bacterium]|nr:hypothetical protein [Desulfobulbaceae bacterium]